MADWKKTEVRRLICEALDPVVSPAEFRFRKKSEGFVRKIREGRQELVLGLVDYNPEFWFSFALGIRLDAVQEITNRFSGAVPSHFDIGFTSVTQLEHLGLPSEKGLGVWFKLRSEAEFVAMLPSICAVVRERLLPFFEQYKDSAAINRGLNPAGAERVHKLIWPADRREFDASNAPYRQLAGVAVAYVAGDPRLNELIAAYRSQLSSVSEEFRSKFERMVDYLDDGAPRPV